ncbi:MAG: peptidoglycan DD-metalloendopeptidase family protein [Firmicutes bacterium]|nr:peptidoglycan DD-metalloendopeptidase family protein [Bacillota bacterium]
MAKWQTAVKASAVLKNKADKLKEKAHKDGKPKKKSSITWAAIFRRLNEIAMDHAGNLVTDVDKVLDFGAWSLERTSVLALRRVHDFRVGANEHADLIKKIVLYAIGAAVVILGITVSAIDYTYSYNGRTLGVVREQNDVLEVLDLVSEELTKEYGATIAIDPDKDITFSPVISSGMEIDSPDAILQKFTYMGDIETKAYAIVIDDIQVAVLPTEDMANRVIDTIIDSHILGDRRSYETVEIKEDVVIQEKTLKLSAVNSMEDAINIIDGGISKTYLYTVKEGDTLETAAKELNTTVDSLVSQNQITKGEGTLPEGLVLRNTVTNKTISVKTVGVETFAEVVPCETVYQESDQYYEGDEIVSVEGQDGKNKVKARITRVDGEITERDDLEVEEIIPEIDRVIIKGTAERPPTVGCGKFIRPCSLPIYYHFGWRWGRMHEGIDMSGPSGTPIYAADGGIVVTAGWYQGYGLAVIVDHQNGYKSLYGHCSSLLVSVGDGVYQGQHIANVGSTGNSTGPHLHFEIWVNGTKVDPEPYIS